MLDRRTFNPALLVTCMRIALIVPFAMCFFLPDAWAVWGAGSIFVLAGVSDAADGWLARRFDMVTDLGAALDPVADKIIQAVALVMLTADERVPAVAAALLLARDFLIGGMREVARGKAVLAVSAVAKAKTALQFVALSILLFAPGIPMAGWLQDVGLVLLWIAVALSLWSGTAYMSRAVRALSTSK